MRRPMEVVNKMTEVEGLPPEVKEHLDWLSNDFSYKAPEQAYECFLRLSDYCDELLPFPPEETGKLKWRQFSWIKQKPRLGLWFKMTNLSLSDKQPFGNCPECSTPFDNPDRYCRTCKMTMEEEDE